MPHSSPGHGVIHSRLFYSVLNELTGFLIAARMAWKLIVINAISAAAMPATINTG